MRSRRWCSAVLAGNGETRGREAVAPCAGSVAAHAQRAPPVAAVGSRYAVPAGGRPFSPSPPCRCRRPAARRRRSRPAARASSHPHQLPPGSSLRASTRSAYVWATRGGELFDKRSGETFFARGPSYLRLEDHRRSADVDAVPARERRSGAHRRRPRRHAAARFQQRQGVHRPVRPAANVHRQPRGWPQRRLHGQRRHLPAPRRRERAAGDARLSTTCPAGYASRLPCCEPFGGTRNAMYLAPEGPEIAAEYWRDIITALRERDAPLDTILAYELAQEQSVVEDEPPLSWSSGDGDHRQRSDLRHGRPRRQAAHDRGQRPPLHRRRPRGDPRGGPDGAGHDGLLRAPRAPRRPPGRPPHRAHRRA